MAPKKGSKKGAGAKPITVRHLTMTLAAICEWCRCVRECLECLDLDMTLPVALMSPDPSGGIPPKQRYAVGCPPPEPSTDPPPKIRYSIGCPPPRPPKRSRRRGKSKKP